MVDVERNARDRSPACEAPRRSLPPPGSAWRLARAIGLTAIAACALAGCETFMVATGARVRLEGVPLQSIAATLNAPRGLAPGSSAALSVVATTTDGRRLATAGTGDGKVLPDSYVFESSVVDVDRHGVVSLPADPRVSRGLAPHVRITAAGQPSPAAEIDIPIRYDVPYAGTYSGPAGMDGSAGFDGSPGFNGDMGSFDVDHPSAGGNGSNGGDGQDGSSGGDGGPGPDVHVWIALESGARPMLRVRASEGGRDHLFLLDPQGGSLSIDVQGGRGGRGGAGGHGGSGGQGGAGQPNGFSGMAGHDGSDGQSGRGGAAGHVSVAIDPAARPYLDRFHFTTRDGDGRPGQAPSIVTQAVPAPW